MQVDDETGHEMCGYCGWCDEYFDSHVQQMPFCPTVRTQFHVWVDDDGELCWRRRDFLWMIPRLLAWSRRAIARVEREYAPDGPRARHIIEEWSVL